MEEQHVYTHNENDHVSVNLSVERNTKGYNYSATVVNAKSVEDGMVLIKNAIKLLEFEYGKKDEAAG
jgi:hypothetical protein